MQAADRLERHQVPLYLGAVVIGAAVGLLIPGSAAPAAAAINPALGTLLYATFLGVPFARIGGAIRDWRFLLSVCVVNFAVVPLVVFAVSRLVAQQEVLLIGVLFVLLTPCIDYVIVFTGLAGGAKDRLLAAAPVLMLMQMLLLPGYLRVLAGPEFARTVDLAVFAEAFVVLIVLPATAAVLTQLAAARTAAGRAITDVVLAAMVPLMMLTLGVVVASQVRGVSQELGALLTVVPVYVLFAAVMVPIGAGVGRLVKLDVPGRRAVVFSGVTRNSLVVLPLVLALPRQYALAPLVVVTQTLVELLVMIAFVRLVPRLLPLSGSRDQHLQQGKDQHHDQ